MRSCDEGEEGEERGDKQKGTSEASVARAVSYGTMQYEVVSTLLPSLHSSFNLTFITLTHAMCMAVGKLSFEL